MPEPMVPAPMMTTVSIDMMPPWCELIYESEY
jgi:hypothetical protein